MGPIYIMWKRQLLRFSRSKSRLIISLFQPLFFLIAFGFGFGPVFQKATGGDYISFLAPGIVAMTILFGAIFNGIETIWDKQFGFLKESLVAPVSRTKIMLGRTLGGATVAILQGLLILLITLLFGFKIIGFMAFLIALIIMFMIAVFFTSLGIMIASKVEDMQAFPMVMNLLVMPMFFLSGALFSISTLPTALKYLTYLNPMVYGVDALRGVLTGVYTFSLLIDFVVLSIFIIFMLILGARSFSKIEV